MSNEDLKIEKTPTRSLEELIIEGTNLEVPIVFDFPTNDGMVPVSAIIKPVSSVDWNNAVSKYGNLKSVGEFTTEILCKGLFNDKGEPLKKELIGLIPAGVADELLLQIQDLSGIKRNKDEQYKLTKELMGF